MKPSKSILDRSFVYVPSAHTSVDQTWRRFGWRPLTEQGGAHESGAAAMDVAGDSSSSPQ